MMNFRNTNERTERIAVDAVDVLRTVDTGDFSADYVKDVSMFEAWDFDVIRRVCIEHNYFNAGSVGAYNRLAGFVDTVPPTPGNIARAAHFIAKRTLDDDGQSPRVSAVAATLAGAVIRYFSFS